MESRLQLTGRSLHRPKAARHSEHQLPVLKATLKYASKGMKEKEKKADPLVTSHRETLEERLRRLSRQREDEARIKNNMAKTELRRQLESVRVDEYEAMKVLSREITIIEWEGRQIQKTNDRRPEIAHLKRRLESRAGSGMCPRFRMKQIKHECSNAFRS